MSRTKKEERLSGASRQIVEAARKKLLQDAPELLQAIYLMKAEETEEAGALRADGLTIWYHPESVVRDHLADRKAIPRQLLHLLCHGLLGHFERRRGQTALLFDAAADVCACALALRIDSALSGIQDRPEEAQGLVLECSGSVDALYLAQESKEQAARFVRDAGPLRRDDHALWDKAAEKRGAGAADAVRGLWQRAAIQTAEAMERSGKGDTAGMLSELFREAEPSTVSYREFLRRFCRLREKAAEDPDSINRIWYHLGLELTGDTPILEPDELREEQKLEHIAVAIDTSGSCGGEVAQGFLRELLAVLRDGGGPKLEFTLIQCDAEIQKVETLSAEDCEEQILNGLELRGWGGTDFRPVFDYVTASREAEDGVKFSGLLYFTDGWGDYPETAPDYPAAFIYPKGEELFWQDLSREADWLTRVFITPSGELEIKEAEGGNEE